jgi:hypothetical protein
MRSVLLSPETKALIARVYLQKPKQKAPEVCFKVWQITHKENPALPKNWPSLSSIQKELARIRRGMNEPSPEDKPWTLDTLRDKPLPPEALPKVFQIWLYKQINSTSPPLTIREARWIAQLSSMTEDIELLRLVAEMCAERELIGDLTNTPQLSMPSMILHIYAELTEMSLETKQEHYQAMRKGKDAAVSAPRAEQVVKGLGAVYGDEFLKAMNLKSKKNKGGTK